MNENMSDIVELEKLKSKIETLSKEHHITILKMLKKTIPDLNENKNGVFINLTDISPFALDELKNYCNYIDTQEVKLDKIENNQKEIESSYFT
jgi:hypothetical protein